MEDGRERFSRGHRRDHRRDRDAWDVLIVDHHEGYVSWEEFERNQRVIADNANCMGLMARGAEWGNSYTDNWSTPMTSKGGPGTPVAVRHPYVFCAARSLLPLVMTAPFGRPAKPPFTQPPYEPSRRFLQHPPQGRGHTRLDIPLRAEHLAI